MKNKYIRLMKVLAKIGHIHLRKRSVYLGNKKKVTLAEIYHLVD